MNSFFAFLFPSLSGDLSRYPEDISNTFVKCFCQLTMQAPVIATLLSIIARSNREFIELVLQKTLTQFNASLKSGDVLVARNLFRVLSCLASTNTISLEGGVEPNSSGFIDLIKLLCSIAEFEVFSISQYSIGVEAAIFILSSCVPYYANLLHLSGINNAEIAQLSSRISAICRAVAPIDENQTASCRASRYDVGGSHAVFHVSIEGTTPPMCAHDTTSVYTPQSTSPVGAVCWDSLWEVGFIVTASLIFSRHVALPIISSLLFMNPMEQV